MTSDRTIPRPSIGVPIKGVRAEVVAGPDQGTAATADSDAISVGTAETNQLVLSDPTVSRFHLELERRANRILVTDLGSTNGTEIGAALLRGGSVEVAAGTEVRIGDTRLCLTDGKIGLMEAGWRTLGGLSGRTPEMRRLIAKVEKVAQSDVSVHIVGESGTGKDLIARAIHDASRRAGSPMVTVDCGAIPPTLFSSELFGHERGAFTDASARRIGAFERASGGTIFLDEIGELPPAVQATLLGVLERRRVTRVGGNQEIELDVRVISATHRDIRAEVNRGSFRLDLFYRLAVVSIRVPPLRDRIDELPLLMDVFLKEAGDPRTVQELFPATEMDRFRAHPWPGNVRELKNVVLGTLALGERVVFDADFDDRAGTTEVTEATLDRPYREARGAVTDAFERRYLARLLERAKGSVRQAARLGAMDRTYLTELLRKHRIR